MNTLVPPGFSSPLKHFYTTETQQKPNSSEQNRPEQNRAVQGSQTSTVYVKETLFVFSYTSLPDNKIKDLLLWETREKQHELVVSSLSFRVKHPDLSLTSQQKLQ